MLIVYHGEAGPRQRERFAEVAAATGHVIEVCAPGDAAALDALLPVMDVWWHVLTPISDTHLARAPRLRLIHKWGVGLNTIDVAAAERRGIAVRNMPGSNASAAAELTLMLMLAVMRRLPAYHPATARGEGWNVDTTIGEQCREISGSTIGLIGYGDIAQRVGAVIAALGARVVHTSRRRDRPGWMPLEELLALSDVVSLHVPLTPETELIMNAERLAMMRPGSVLINTARGGLVDLDAVGELLDRGHLGGVGLDVFPAEPWTHPHALALRPDVVVTPHVAWLTWETLARSLALAMEAVEHVGVSADGPPGP